MIKIRCTLIFLCVVASFMTACKKNETLEVDSETQSAVDHAIAGQEFISLVQAVFQHLSRTAGAGFNESYPVQCEAFTFNGGDTVTFKPNPIYLLDAAKTNCSLNDSKVRSGKIIIRLTEHQSVAGAQAIIKLENYIVDEVAFTADSIIIKQNGSNNSYYSLKMTVVNGACSTGKYHITYRDEHTLSVYPRSGPLGPGAQTSFYGNSSGVNRAGLPFTVNVTNDVFKLQSCKYFTKGKIELIPKGYKQRVIDFGDGTCDEEGTFTVSENTVAFKLK